MVLNVKRKKIELASDLCILHLCAWNQVFVRVLTVAEVFLLQVVEKIYGGAIFL